MDGPRPDNKNERVWDPLVRLFHWSLMTAFATAWFARGEAWLHEGAGKLVLSLVIFRLVWGIIGPGSARFENFLRGPIATTLYVWDILRGRPAHYVGHNPAGAAMILLLLATLAVTTVSGILMSTTKFWGNGSIEYVHGQAANLMLWLIAGHVLGVLVASFQHKDNLIFSMVTGWKTVPTETAPYLGNVMWTFRRLMFGVFVAGTAVLLWQLSVTLFNASFWRIEKVIAAAAKQAGCIETTITGPVVMIYPTQELQYTVSAHAKIAQIVVPAELALQKKAAIDVEDIKRLCPTSISSPVVVPQPQAIPAISPPTTTLAFAMAAKPFRQAVAMTRDWGMRPSPAMSNLSPAKNSVAIVSSQAVAALRVSQVSPRLPLTGKSLKKVSRPLKVRTLKSVRQKLGRKRRVVYRPRHSSGHHAGGGSSSDHDDNNGHGGRGRGRSGRGGGDH